MIRAREEALLLAAAVVLLGSSTALAQPRATTEDWERRDIRALDAHSDRVAFLPTGDVLPDGAFALSNYEIAVLRFAYGLGEDVTLDFILFPPWDRLFGDDDDMPLVLDAAVRVNLVRTDGFRAAVLGSGMASLDLERGRDTLFGLRLMATGQVCFEPACSASINFGVGGMLLFADSETLRLAVGGVGIVGRVSEAVSFIGEPAAVVVSDEDGDSEGLPVFSYGVRVSFPNAGLDLLLVRPFGEVCEGEDVFFCVVGFPLVMFTYRSDPTTVPAVPGVSPLGPATAAAPAALGPLAPMLGAFTGAGR